MPCQCRGVNHFLAKLAILLRADLKIVVQETSASQQCRTASQQY